MNRHTPRRGPLLPWGSALLVGRMLVELGFIRERSFFRPLYAGPGLLLVWLGTRLHLAGHVEATESTPTSKEVST